MRLRLERGGGGGGGLGLGIATLMLVVCAAVGALGTYAIALDWLRIVASHGWPEVPCTIEASRLVEEPGSDAPYRFAVQYRYRYEGREYRSAVVSPHYAGSNDLAEAQRLALRYPPGAAATCIVDPDAPSRASLHRDSLWRGLPILGTLLFLALGALGLWALWGSGLRARSGEARPRRARGAEGGNLLSRAASAGGGRGCLAAFFSVFLAAGLAFFIPFFGVPLYRVMAARGWQAVPCTIERSWVQSHPGDDNDTYSVQVLYAYEAAGHALKGNRYSFLGGSSSGYDGKAEIVAALPAGTRTTCWVNPADPADSVLQRNPTPGFLIGLLPLLFVAVGAGGVVFALRSGGGAAARRERRHRWLPEPGTGTRRERRRKGRESVVLEAQHGPVAKFFGTLAAAVIWNGITGVFVYFAVEGWRTGSGDGCLTLFLVPFVLVGLLLLVSVPYQFLALFNPRPKLVLSASTLPVGSTLLLEWSFRGAAGRLQRLRITLVGREEATYRRGTSSSTSTEVFAEIPVVDHARPHPLATGHATVQVPADTMHSFVGDHNKIVWLLQLRGEIRAWPDVSEDFELTVTPQEIS